MQRFPVVVVGITWPPPLVFVQGDQIFFACVRACLPRTQKDDLGADYSPRVDMIGDVFAAQICFLVSLVAAADSLSRWCCLPEMKRAWMRLEKGVIAPR